MRRSTGASVGRYVFICFAAALLILPTLTIVPMSFTASDVFIFPPAGFSLRWYRDFFMDTAWQRASLNSVAIATGTTLIATLIGTLAALGFMRVAPRYRGFLMILFLVPAIVPTIVTAVAMYNMFSHFGLTDTMSSLILAHSVLALPFVLIYVLAVLQKVDWRIEQAARSLGAPPSRVFSLVILPAIRPGILVGAFFAFLTSFDEIVVALFLSGSHVMTLPVKMWEGIRFELSPTVGAVAVILTIISSCVFAVTTALRKKT
jgi:putative spermidine/putrescine transport system permease protein